MSDYNQQPVVGKQGDVTTKDGGKSWFYTDTVKDHFFHPRNFMMEDADPADYNAIGKVGSPACGDELRVWMKVDPTTERILEFRWKTFGSLVADEQVMLEDFTLAPVQKIKKGMRVVGGDGQVNVVESIFKKKYSGKVVTLKLSTSNYYEFACTPIHPVPCVPRDAVSYPHRKSGHWSEVHQDQIEKAEIIVKPASELKEGDFMVYQASEEVTDDVELTPDICTLLGYYVSDGTCPSARRVRFDFGPTEQAYADEVCEIAKKLGVAERVFPRKDARIIAVTVTDKRLVALLMKHGGGPSRKRFSPAVLLLPSRKQERIIDAYVSGDGWTQQQDTDWNEQYFISTSKEHLAFQLQWMLARIGIFAPIHKREPRSSTIRGKKFTNRGEYNLIFRKRQQYSRVHYSKSGKYFLIPIQKIARNDYEGTIYDFGLENVPYQYKLKGIAVHNCGSAIASTSMASVMVTENGGMTLDEARKIRPQDIMDRLGGLPARKFHCSVLCDKALRDAINDFYRRTDQADKMVVEESRIIDPVSKVTDHDIEEAVIEGAVTIEAVQQKTKVGIGNPSVLPAVEELIRFYKEKYFGA